MMRQLDPFTAVTHTDPYGYYADLLAQRPLYYDQQLGMWVASSVAVLLEIFHHPYARVRPPAEPVPSVLLGTPVATIFARLVRMIDGPSRCPIKASLVEAHASYDPAHFAALARHHARSLLRRSHLRLEELSTRLPCYVLADLFGFAPENVEQIRLLVADFVAGIAPAPSTDAVERASLAAQELLHRFDHLYQRQASSEREAGLLLKLIPPDRERSPEQHQALIANAIGLFSQAYDAGAGLIGNSLLALQARPELWPELRARPELCTAFVEEVARYDPPIQNTRRFFAHASSIAGQQLGAGDTVLLLLAAANRDPALNPGPEHFLLDRPKRRSLSFGEGAHACLGQTLAIMLVSGLIQQLVQDQRELQIADLAYKTSLNARIPTGMLVLAS